MALLTVDLVVMPELGEGKALLPSLLAPAYSSSPLSQPSALFSVKEFPRALFL